LEKGIRSENQEGDNEMEIKVGTKIKFPEEKQRYTVQCYNERYVICTKPLNCLKTVLYTIIDFKENIRGAEDLVLCMGFETKEGCQEALERLITGVSEVSYRNRIPLSIESLS